MKLLLLTFILSFLFLVNCSGQDNKPTCYNDIRTDRNPLSIGSKKIGVGFGSFGKYNGLTFSLQDNTCILNGIGFSVMGNINTRKRSRGIEVGVFPFISKMNGFVFGLLLGGVDHQLNGISVFGIFGDTWKTNGISMCGIAQLNDRVNGLTFSGVGLISNTVNGVGVTPMIQRVDSLTNGVAISGLSYISEKTNGISIAPLNINHLKGNGVQIGVFNLSGQYNGVQLGLINVIQENPKVLRVLPFINMNFTKDDPLYREFIEITASGDTLKTVKTYYPTKVVKSEAKYRNSSADGLWVEYHKNGKPSTIKTYVKGVIVGSIKNYYSNGVLLSEVPIENGQTVSNYWIYNRRGKRMFFVTVD